VKRSPESVRAISSWCCPRRRVCGSASWVSFADEKEEVAEFVNKAVPRGEK